MLMLPLFKAMVIPIVEYCCHLWNPMSVGLIRQLEAVQRHFTSGIMGLEALNYWERLRVLRFYSGHHTR